MNFEALQTQFRIRATGAGPRFARLDVLERFLKGTQYENLMYEFYHKVGVSDEYIPLRERKPSVIYNMPKIVVDRSTDMLFGDGHWPEIHIDDSKDKLTEQALQFITQMPSFKKSWKKAARMGSVGSVAIVFKWVDGRLYHEVINAKNCSVRFHNRIPDEIVELEEKKRVKGIDLMPYGYDLDPDKDYWYRRVFNTREEIEYYPKTVEDTLDGKNLIWKANPDRSFKHNFGFLPGVWVRNLESEDKLDGESTFEALCGFQVELDYQLSQTGRALHYTQDPLLILKDPSFIDPENEEQNRIRSAGNALILNAEGDAKNLEIQAEAQRVALEYIDKLRSFALELTRGNRADADKLTQVTSAKALALLHKDIIGLVSDLRTSYGDEGLIPYLRKILMSLEYIETAYPKVNVEVNPDALLELRWGAYFEPTSEDDRSMLLALREAIGSGVMSKERGTRIIAPRYNISDAQSERKQIDKERAELIKTAKDLDAAQQASMKAKKELLGGGTSSGSPPA